MNKTEMENCVCCTVTTSEHGDEASGVHNMLHKVCPHRRQNDAHTLQMHFGSRGAIHTQMMWSFIRVLKTYRVLARPCVDERILVVPVCPTHVDYDIGTYPANCLRKSSMASVFTPHQDISRHRRAFKTLLAGFTLPVAAWHQQRLYNR